MKYPIDPQTTEAFFGHLIAHERAQRQMIQAMSIILELAVADSAGENDWYEEASKLVKLQKKLKMDHDNRIFNAKNGHHEPIGATLVTPEIVQSDYSDVSLGMGNIDDPETRVKLNEAEKSFGEEMSEEDLARHFNQRSKKKAQGSVNLSSKDPFKGMTLEEIENWEAAQHNANDIYKIKARIQNLAVGISGGNLTAVGEMMVNSFVHVVKDLYDFADTIQDKTLKISLIERIRKHEGMPGNLISAAASGVRTKPGPKS